MQGKGSGAVNRVELECQVLCAALRQSWVRQDKVGAFTSIRELSHLFPDLLPPPEERGGSNRANYYEVLEVRPGSGLNALVIGYLRAVRKFLRDHNPKDYRQYYNTMLNAGFVLRKPRLRLSHDLVVARRWLYESQLEEEEAAEPAEPVAEAVPGYTAAAEEPAPVPHTPVAEEAPYTPQAEAPVEPQTSEPEAQPYQQEAAPPQAEYTPAEHDYQQPASYMQQEQVQEEPSRDVTEWEQQSPSGDTLPPQAEQLEEDDEDFDPLELIQKSWEQTRSSQTPSRSSFEMPTTQIAESKGVAAASAHTTQELPIPQQTAAPPMPPLPSAQPEFAPVQSTPSVTPPQIETAPPPAVTTPEPARTVTVPPVPPLPAAAYAENAMTSGSSTQQQSSPISTTTPVQEPQQHVINPAQQAPHTAAQVAPSAAHAQANTPSVKPAVAQSAPQAKPRSGFHFDEKQLRKPEADIELPGPIRLLEAAHLLTKVEVQALKAQMQLAPNIPVEQLVLNAGYATKNELSSLRLAQDLLSSGKINMAQFQVAMYDERTSGLRMAESLQVRGWLQTEVRNPIEEFKKND